MSRTKIRVALDWTPNTIHSGLFVGIEKGFYKDQELDVQLLPPDNGYTVTPARRLLNGEVDLAICPSESCIAYNENNRMQLQAIYAILQRDASAIVSVKHDKLSALANGTYGSYNARYEDSIVRTMVNASGGDGQKMKIQNATGKLSLFEETRKGNLDATWIFEPWEGVEAELDQAQLHTFKPEDYGVPYGYSPVIARNVASSPTDEVLRKFTEATTKGYDFASRHTLETANILVPHCRPQRSREFLALSQERISEYYSDESGNLGIMSGDKWETWIRWLKERRLVQENLQAKVLFTNVFF